jgi:hypothetical protein
VQDGCHTAQAFAVLSGRPHTGQRGRTMTGTTTEKKKGATETMALWISVVSFLIATVAAAFAVYLWYFGRIEAKRLATVELSIKIVTDPKTYELMNKTDEYLRGNGDEPHFAAAESWTIYLDYIAYLADEGEIDDAYLVPFVKCQIVSWDMNVLQAQRAPVPASAARLVRFGPHAVSYLAKHRDHLDCP